jgi:histidine triad (HIT) family protein
MTTDCIFCKIVAGELPAKKVYEDDQIIAFYDIHPKASVHLLVIPKKHIETLNELTSEDSALISQLVLALPEIAAQQNLEGFRVVVNNGPGSGQIVYHLHFHILGGKQIPSF